MDTIVEALLNDELSNFPKYVYEEGFDIKTLGLEGILIYRILSRNIMIDEIALWETNPGDLRLFNWCVRKQYSFFSMHVNFTKMLTHKSYDKLSIESFEILCESIYRRDADFNNKLIEVYELFSESGILHRSFLNCGKFYEYLNLSAQYRFTITKQYWYNDNYESDDKIYVSDSTARTLEVDAYSITHNDINHLRQVGVFSDRYLKVYNELILSFTVESQHESRSLIQFIIRHFDQLTLEEKTIWMNIIKLTNFNLNYYKFIKDKDTLDVMSDLFNEDQKINYDYLRIFSIYCSIVMLEYFINKLPEQLVIRLKLYMIIYYDDEKIKYFFGEVTQDVIDELVKKLIK